MALRRAGEGRRRRLRRHEPEFIPGRYIKPGYTITTRGMPASVLVLRRLEEVADRERAADLRRLERPRRQPPGLPREHVEAVFAMLRRQKRRVEFTGGLEALSLQDYQVDLLASLKPRPNMFFAYDPQDAFETLESAARRLLDAGFTRSSLIGCAVTA
jgi:hypothetical protein